MNHKIIKKGKDISKCFLIRIDGNAKPNPGDVSYGIAIHTPEPRKILYDFGYFKNENKNNNESEFMCLIKALELALENNIFDIIVEGDSQFVVDIISTEVKPKGIYKEYYAIIIELTNIFDTFFIKHIPRKDNIYADTLARRAYKLKTNFKTEYF